METDAWTSWQLALTSDSTEMTQAVIGGSSGLYMWLTEGFSVTFLEGGGDSALTHDSLVEGTFTYGNYSYVGLTHMWRGHSHVGLLLMCGRDIQVWELLICGGDIHMWELLTCGGDIHAMDLLMCGTSHQSEILHFLILNIYINGKLKLNVKPY